MKIKVIFNEDNYEADYYRKKLLSNIKEVEDNERFKE